MWLKFVILFGAIFGCNGADFSFIAIIQDRIDLIENSECKDYMSYYLLALNNTDAWATTMFDATGKIPSGIMTGNLHEMGNFDECLQIDDVTSLGKIEGKYCLGTIPITESIFNGSSNNISQVIQKSNRAAQRAINGNWGICLPHVCSHDDLNIVFGGFIKFTEAFCQTKSTSPSLATGDFIAIAIIAALILVIFLSTTYDIYLTHSEKKTQLGILLAFSILTNSRKLFHVSEKPNNGQITCLAGIRSISMMWVIFCHGYLINLTYPVSNTLDTLKWINGEENMFVLGGTVAVDTFFLMSGLVLVYVYMSKPKMRIINIPYFYIHRYLRLTPVLAAVIGFHLTLMKHISDGPFWPSVLSDNYCEKGWWATLLYINNYATDYAGCVGQSWYLSVDTQLYFLSPLLLIPMRKYLKATFIVTVILSVVSMGTSFYIAWHYNLNGLAYLNGDNLDYTLKYYVPLHTRAAPWLFGLIFGYIIHKHQKDKTFEMKMPLLLLLWISSLTILCVCVFCGHGLFTNDDKFANSSYLAFLRPSWAIAVGWVIYACTNGYGGPINKFLSLPIFQVIGRLSYTMFIVHYMILTLLASSIRSPQRFSNGILMYKFWSNFMLTFAVAVVLTLCFESPVIIIEKYLTKEKKMVQRDKVIGIQNEGYNKTENEIITLPRVT